MTVEAKTKFLGIPVWRAIKTFNKANGDIYTYAVEGADKVVVTRSSKEFVPDYIKYGVPQYGHIKHTSAFWTLVRRDINQNRYEKRRIPGFTTKVSWRQSRRGR